MREIKFRCFDPSTKKMFIPDVVTGDGRNVFESGRDYENGRDCNDCPLMQYTGLKDKNGKPIYEGDIIRYRLGAGLGLPESGTYEEVVKITPYGCVTHYYKDIVIIGNRFENPNLLT